MKVYVYRYKQNIKRLKNIFLAKNRRYTTGRLFNNLYSNDNF